MGLLSSLGPGVVSNPAEAQKEGTMTGSAKDQVQRAMTDPKARVELEDEKGDRAKITPIGVEQRINKAFADPSGSGTRLADSDASGAARTVTGAEFRDRGEMLVDTSDQGTNVAASKAAQLHDRGEMLVVSDAETNLAASHAAQLHDRGDEMLPISGDTAADLTPPSPDDPTITEY